MKKALYILLLIGLLPTMGFGQHARIHITSGYLKIGASGNGSYSASNLTQTYFVIDNLNTTALLADAGTGIITEAEFNMVQWNIGANTGTYTLPFVYTDLTPIPLTAVVSAAGTNAGTGNAAIEFSTWDTQPDNANGTQSIDGMPYDVTNMRAQYAQSNPLPSVADDSYNAVDRFWVIDAGDAGGIANTYLPSGVTAQHKYTAGSSPTIALTFYYLGAADASSEVSSPNVQPMDGQLIPQRYNSTQNNWGDYLPSISGANTAGGSTGNLATVAVSSANWFRSWTLANSHSPLPIKLLSFNVECQNNEAIIHWSTATEVNNDYFTIARSSDGINYQAVAIVKGAGNSSTTLNYSTVDTSPLFGTSYYRLSQTDFDGNTVIAGSVSFTACGNHNSTTINAYGTSNFIDVQINSIENDNAAYTISLTNDLGQNILTENKTVNTGINEFKLYTEIPNGVYFLIVATSTNVYHKKILIKK